MVATFFILYFLQWSATSYVVHKPRDSRKSLIHRACPDCGGAVWTAGWALPGNTNLPALVLGG